MTTLREAVEQALEALELGYDAAKSEADQYHTAMAGYKPQRHAQMDAEVQQIAAAITALRAALAQQAEPAQDLYWRLHNLSKALEGSGRIDERDHPDAYATILDAMALAQQAEPVSADVAYQRWLADTHAPALRRMDSQGAFAAGWQAALAQQAEPVPVAWSGYDLDGMVEAFSRVIEALRLAGLALIGLAEHDQHCDVFDLDDQGRHKACTCGLNDAIAVITQAGKSAPPRQAEPVEPVAWMHNILADNIIKHRPADLKRSPQNWTPLCKCADTPPQRKPLTEEEIDAEWRKAASEEGFTTMQFVRNFARAVEAAHGITDPQVEDRLARHGISLPDDENPSFG